MLPSVQFPEPDALVDTRFITHVLVAGLLALGIGSGGPKRQPGFPGYSGFVTPAAVQLRLLPVSRSVELSDWDPVVRAKGIGKLPMNAAVAGGQSWLVG